MVRLPDREETLLANIKAVEPGYPFYGTVELASGRDFATVLAPGAVIAEQALLDRLGVVVGDRLDVGAATVTIDDVVLNEPDRPVNFFALGPRLFVAAADLPALDLVKPGSRVTFTTLLKVADEAQLDSLADQLRDVRDLGQESVETYRTAPSGVQRFFDNLLFFLSLVAIFTLLLAGIGIQSALTAFLRERYTAIAIVKTLGATRRFVTLHFYAVVAILGLIGAAIGLVMGVLLEMALPVLLRGLLPPDVELTLTLRALIEGMLLGGFVVVAFTFFPLYQLGQLRPNFIFRKEAIGIERRGPYIVALLLILGAFVAMVLWLLGDVRTSLYFVGAVLGLVGHFGAAHRSRPARIAPVAPTVTASAPGAARPLPAAQPDAGHHHHAVDQPGRALLHLPGRADPGRQLRGLLPRGRAQRLLPGHSARSTGRVSRRAGRGERILPRGPLHDHRHQRRTAQ